MPKRETPSRYAWWSDIPNGSDAPLHQQILDALGIAIGRSSLLPGMLLPTHRLLADELGVARGTVARAYLDAERLGLVVGEGRRGTRVAEPGAEGFGSLLRPSASPIDLSLNVPLDALNPDIALALRDIAERPDRFELLRYHPHAGLQRHRAAGARWARAFEIDCTAEDVLVCSGAQHASYLVVSALLRPGDTVLVESFTYPGFLETCKQLGVRALPVSMDSQGIILRALEHAVRRSSARLLYTIPTMQNPSNAIQSEDRRREIAAICSRYGVAVLEDDIHKPLASGTFTSLRELLPELAFSIASTSKSLCGGLRTAFLVAPKRYRPLIERHIWATNWMAAPIGAELVAYFIESGIAADTLRRKKREARVRQDIARKVLGEIHYSANTPPTSLYVWLGLRQYSASAFCAEALERGVTLAPAEAFSPHLGSRRDSAATRANHLRISLSAAHDRNQLRCGLRIIREILDHLPASSSAAVLR